MTRLTPDTDQQAAIERMIHEPTRAALNGSVYGTGKTLVTVEVAEGIGAKVKLIVCPIFTKYSWEDTILKQYPDAVVQHINSRKAGKEALADLLAGVEGWYIVGREYFASKSVREHIVKAAPKVIDFLAYDECQKWANRLSQGFRFMKRVKPGYKMALSATPAGNKFTGLWTITRWLWPEITPLSFWKWVAQWARTEEDYFAGTQVVGEKNPGAYVSQLPCYVRLEKDFGEPYEETIEVDLSPKERAIYDKFERYLIVWLQDNPLIAKIPAVKRIRLRQMTLGEVSIDPDTEVVYFANDMKSTKYETLLGYMQMNEDEPMIIFTDSQKYAEVVTYKLVEDGFKAMEWSGRVPEDIRHGIKDAFVAGDIDYIVATIASIGEGVDGLQHRARTMVWLSRSDNNMFNMQAFRRLYRRGQERQVISIDIAARKTYDRGQLSNLVQQQLNMNATLRKEGK